MKKIRLVISFLLFISLPNVSFADPESEFAEVIIVDSEDASPSPAYEEVIIIEPGPAETSPIHLPIMDCKHDDPNAKFTRMVIGMSVNDPSRSVLTLILNPNNPEDLTGLGYPEGFEPPPIYSTDTSLFTYILPNGLEVAGGQIGCSTIYPQDIDLSDEAVHEAQLELTCGESKKTMTCAVYNDVIKNIFKNHENSNE